MSNPFDDVAAPILTGEPAITDDQRGDLWQHFHESQSADELATRIAPLNVSIQLKSKLYNAKADYLKPTEPIDKIVAALERLKDVDANALEKAEAHPAVLKQITDIL
ncbi:MAG: hypothetical protein WAN23_00685 [Candidatus Acidiferrales bacterium]